MRSFDVISKKDITDDQEVNITAMGWNDDERAIAIPMILNFCNF